MSELKWIISPSGTPIHLCNGVVEPDAPKVKGLGFWPIDAENKCVACKEVAPTDLQSS